MTYNEIKANLEKYAKENYKDLIKAIKETLVNVIQKRCQVHSLRNILSKAPKENTEEFRTDIKALFEIQDIILSRKLKMIYS